MSPFVNAPARSACHECSLWSFYHVLEVSSDLRCNAQQESGSQKGLTTTGTVMAPIRTAIIGLSASAITSWASEAHLPYLLSPRGRARFTIVALCNSSVDAARRAIETFQLPAQTHAYGTPEALAADPEVQLVVCCTRTDVHYETIMPGVRAGKGVFVEWPLAQDLAHARELLEVAGTAPACGLAAVGLQGRLSPAVEAVRRFLHEGRIGKVLSSEVLASGGSIDRETLSSGLRYFTELKYGANIVTIGFGHLFDQVQHVLGELSDLRARLQLQRPEVKLVDPSTKETSGTTRSQLPDLILATGMLKNSPVAHDGATVSLRFRRGQPFPGTPGLAWTIAGEKGELRLVAPGGPTLQSSAYTQPVTIQLHDFASDTLKEVAWHWETWQEELPLRSRSVALVYERIAQGDVGGTFPSFAAAVTRHEQLAELLAPWSAGRTDA